MCVVEIRRAGGRSSATHTSSTATSLPVIAAPRHPQSTKLGVEAVVLRNGGVRCSRGGGSSSVHVVVVLLVQAAGDLMSYGAGACEGWVVGKHVDEQTGGEKERKARK